MSSPAAMRALTSASIWAGVSPSGSAVVDTIVLERASTGKSHSKVTPTTESPAPMAKRISVADGSSDTMRCRRPPEANAVERPAEEGRQAVGKGGGVRALRLGGEGPASFARVWRKLAGRGHRGLGDLGVELGVLPCRLGHVPAVLSDLHDGEV